MLTVIFTLDYEIHGNGEGEPYALMVEPTSRLMRLFEEYGAKLTVMADVAEILRFKEHYSAVGTDDFHVNAIERQLKEGVTRGHDVQLHIHSSYYGSRYENGRWIQNWELYNFAELPFARMDSMIREGKEYLESLFQPKDPSYRCNVFRAANWAVSPSQNVVDALVKNGIRVDTSVFKYGYRRGLVNFDYGNAPSALIPWKVCPNEICTPCEDGELWEFPIYAEARKIGAFLTLQRLYRAFVGRLHRVSVTGAQPTVPAKKHESLPSRIQKLFRSHAWKADFNQCTARQLILAINRAEAAHGQPDISLPFVLIGHSKLFSRLNGINLRHFLDYVRRNPERFRFGTFEDVLSSKHFRKTLPPDSY